MAIKKPLNADLPPLYLGRSGDFDELAHFSCVSSKDVSKCYTVDVELDTGVIMCNCPRIFFGVQTVMEDTGNVIHLSDDHLHCRHMKSVKLLLQTYIEMDDD